MVGEPGTAPLGRFRHDPASGEWTWSDELYALHGFDAGEVVPSTPLAEAHQHPDDRDAIRALAADVLESGLARGAQYRIVDAAGRERHVVVVVESQPAPTGRVLEGLVLDVSVAHARSSAARANAMLEAATAARTVIDQAKGALMVVHGVAEDAAFEALRWYSQQTNLKLRTLAERVLEATSGPRLLPDDVRRRIDGVLHAAIADGPADGSATSLTPGPTSGPTTALTTGPATGPTTGPATGPATGLTTDEVRLPGATFVRVRGEVDMLTAPDLATALTAAAARTPARAPLVVDLTEVTYLGRAGLAELLACQRRCRQAGTRLRVVVGPDGPALPAGDHDLDLFDDLASAAA